MATKKITKKHIELRATESADYFQLVFRVTAEDKDALGYSREGTAWAVISADEAAALCEMGLKPFSVATASINTYEVKSNNSDKMLLKFELECIEKFEGGAGSYNRILGTDEPKVSAEDLIAAALKAKGNG